MIFKYIFDGSCIKYDYDSKKTKLRLSEKDWNRIRVLIINKFDDDPLPEYFHLIALPESLHSLTIKNQPITELPSLVTMPKLRSITINETNLKKVPKLPSQLEILNLEDNQIESFEDTEFPKSIVTIQVGYNKITQLPRLPHENIVNFNVNDNQLEYIDIDCLYKNKLPLLEINDNTMCYASNRWSEPPVLDEYGLPPLVSKVTVQIGDWVNDVDVMVRGKFVPLKDLQYQSQLKYSNYFSEFPKQLVSELYQDICKFIGFSQDCQEMIEFLIAKYNSRCFDCKKEKLIGYYQESYPYLDNLQIRFATRCLECKADYQKYLKYCHDNHFCLN